uniref:Uncharacterized protein n=1 Tax=Rhabditophanes sp. KR3021 TaxID=114890 RepID=A0AC35TFV9_9BILA
MSSYFACQLYRAVNHHEDDKKEHQDLNNTNVFADNHRKSSWNDQSYSEKETPHFPQNQRKTSWVETKIRKATGGSSPVNCNLDMAQYIRKLSNAEVLPETKETVIPSLTFETKKSFADLQIHKNLKEEKVSNANQKKCCVLNNSIDRCNHKPNCELCACFNSNLLDSNVSAD